MTNLLYTLSASCMLFASLCWGSDALNVDIREGRPVVDGVYVNGQGPYRFLLDTGSTLNHIDLRVAKAIGLTETVHTTLTSSTGVTRISGSTGIEVALGLACARNQTILFGLGALRENWPDVKGILGQEFLSHFDYLLEVRRGRIEFGAPERGVKAIRVPYILDHGRPVVQTNLGWLVVDSGAARITRFGIEAAHATLTMRTSAGTTQLGTVCSALRIGDRFWWRGDAVAVPHSIEQGVDGLLPVSVFRSVYVSNFGRYIAFE